MAFKLEIAQEHLDAWLKAELTVTNGQSYTIGTKTLTRANLSQIREQINYWKNEVELARKIQSRKGKNRVFRIVPRDL